MRKVPIPIPSLCGYYATSDGKIWSRKSVNGKGGLQNKFRELKTQIDKDGYRLITFCLGGKKYNGRHYRTMKVNRVIAQTFLKDFKKSCVVMHIDNNRLNDSIYNLKIGTIQENNLQAYTEKRHAFGERGGRAKLNSIKVVNIKKLLSEGIQQKKIAEKYNISRSTINAIHKKRIWTHI